MAYRSTERTERHRAARSAALIDAGLGLVAEGGFSAATIARVADRAGVSTGTVYTYFPDKTALTAAIFDRAAGIELEVVRAAVAFGTDARFETPADQRLDALVRVFGARALRGRTLAMALLFEAADVGVERERLLFRRAYTETVAEVLADGVAEGTLSTERIDLLAPAIVGALGEAFIRPLSPAAGGRSEADTSEVLDSLAAACLRLAGFASRERSGLLSRSRESRTP
ncbi:TetR/AcrR family transcriptional regulator [Leucobacter aridicollis]|uniref:TetR/AcrR family transcriptional regulator n=1 Tax=Leucobacter aridicollis TaxID=283878 RepID=UPI000E658FDA|nr:TetR/AcrR family transcriptional regulator [Leucobacter aridicollis]UTX53049.1 TetR/AcrR family transcriptional regulator [Leucobacter aridicollis]